MKAKLESIFVFILVAIAGIAMVCGCTRTIYQPVETVRTDSITTKAEFNAEQFHYLLNALQRSVNTRDSVVVRDSVVMVINQVGEVVSKETFHDRDRSFTKDEAVLQIQAKYDSIFNAQREEFNAILEQIQQIPVPVEKKLGKWEQFKQDVGGIAIGLFLAVIAIAVIWLIKKFRS